MLKTKNSIKNDILIIAEIIGDVGINAYENNWEELHKLNNLSSKYKFEYAGILLEGKKIASCNFEYMEKKCYIYWSYKTNGYEIIFRG